MGKRYSVYKHTNKVNGKVYIGITSMEPEKRWGNNGRNYSGNKHLSNSIGKYGWDNFEHKVLFKGLRKRKAGRMEARLIEQYDATNPDKGYNKQRGGLGEWGRKNRRSFKIIIGKALKSLGDRLIKGKI